MKRSINFKIKEKQEADGWRRAQTERGQSGQSRKSREAWMLEKMCKIKDKSEQEVPVNGSIKVWSLGLKWSVYLFIEGSSWSSQRPSLFLPYENSIGHNLLRIHMHISSAGVFWSNKPVKLFFFFFYESPSLSRLNEGECVRGTVSF